ncbi:hypothetical protein [Streptomyces sp. CS62]|uniref:hypothetical protein n=1 Tax=Streptomyces sp. CS62 TaxID=3119268 RepID=UPI002F946617
MPEPAPAAGEVVVEVLAAALYPLVRSFASGGHYTGATALPLVPGFDAVARTAGGELVYVPGLEPPHGTMAERIAVPATALMQLPDGLDPVAVAAAVNPGPRPRGSRCANAAASAPGSPSSCSAPPGTPAGPRSASRATRGPAPSSRPDATRRRCGARRNWEPTAPCP